MKQFVRNIVLVFGRLFCSLLRTLGFGRKHKQILFVGETQLMVAYMKEIWQRLDDDRLSLNVTFDRDIDPAVVAAEKLSINASKKIIQCINYRLAMIWQWDLIIFADCTTAWKSFSSKSKKLKIEHGINSGKISRNGKDCEWDDWLLKKDKLPAFDIVFVTNENEKKYGEKQYPSYRERIVVSGDLRFDNILEECKRKEQVRKELGIQQDRKVVLVISSWGPKSLLQTIGEQLYKECSKLTGQYHFIITAHPNNYDRDKNWIDIVQKQKSWGAMVLKPNEDYVKCLSIADVIITDFTSLSLYFVPLLRPIISIPISSSFGVSGSNMYKMGSIATCLESPDKLKDTIEIALSSEISDEHRVFAQELVSHKGRAWKEMRKNIYKLLLLEEPDDEN